MNSNTLSLKRILRAGCLTLAAFGVSACASIQGSYSPAQVAQSRAALQQVQTDYQQGEYGQVIRRVTIDKALNEAPQDIRIQALKLQAFSLCLTQYEFLCQEKFQQILALKPDFQLQASEQGHPLWGPVFERAQESQ